MRIERTYDRALVYRIVSHEGIKPYTWDGDGDPPVPMHESIYYLLPKDEHFADGSVGDRVLGVVAFIPVNTVTWNPHIAIFPEYRGTGTQALQEAMRWMFAHTECKKLVAYPPVFNARMIRVFEKCGFDVEGRSPNSFQWHGLIFDRLLMGTDKEKQSCGPG